MKDFLMLLFVTVTIGLQGAYGQNTEFDLSAGIHVAAIHFDHNFPVSSEDEGEFQPSNSMNLKLGLSVPLDSSSWYLESEFLFFKTNTFFAASYDYDEGFGKGRVNVITHLNNNKVAISIAPEFRTKFKNAQIKFNGGVVISSDISNIMSTTNTIFVPDSNPLGFKFGGGFQYNWEKIGIGMEFLFYKFGSSELQNRYHPKISYNFLSFNYTLAIPIG